MDMGLVLSPNQDRDSAICRDNQRAGSAIELLETLDFALVIPVLNEEEAIGATLERALAARQVVLKKTPVRHMHIVFVNDGSTDGSQAIAERFPEVIKVRFEQNRGYGAAIKAGFAATHVELLGFMDADGTCDPEFCVQLINCLIETKFAKHL